MSKKRYSRSDSSQKRDAGVISRRSRFLSPLNVYDVSETDLSELTSKNTDLRRYDPTETIRMSDGRPVTYTLSDPKKPSRASKTKAWLAFRWPDLVEVCTRRKERRETLFALHDLRRGGGGSFRRKRTNTWRNVSHVKC